MRMKFVLPSLEEQERIATALDALHNHLANEKLLTIRIIEAISTPADVYMSIC